MKNKILIEQGEVIDTYPDFVLIKSHMRNNIYIRCNDTSLNIGEEILYAILLNGDIKVLDKITR